MLFRSDLVSGIERRLPGVSVTLQVDEPSLPAVLAGAVPTEGGFFRHRSVDRPEAVALLAGLGGDVLHCCAPGLDVDLLLGEHGPGLSGVALDQSLITPADWDVLGAAMERGRDLWLGCAPTASPGDAPALSADALTRRVRDALLPLELGPMLSERVVLTPACGLAGWRPSEASALLRRLTVVADRLDDALHR